LEITDQLKEWQLNNKTHVNEAANCLNINVLYKTNGIQGFYLDYESHKVVLSMLCYTYYEEFQDYDTVKFRMNFLGYDDNLTVIYDHQELTKIKYYFEIAPNYYDFVGYSFTNLGYENILRATTMIKYLNDNFNDFFSFKGSYWLLLYNYCKASLDPYKYFNSIYCFIWFASEANNYVPIENFDLFEEHMEYFLKAFGYDDNLLNENFLGILDHLNEKYGRQQHRKPSN
jgi:hypothetical protein